MDTKKILLIEDDALLRELYSDLLKQNNCDVTAADNGLQGYDLIQTGTWDLLLLDLTLPGMSGFDLIKKITSESHRERIKKIVILTNRDEDGETEKLKNSVDGYLIKSKMSPDEFIERVKSFLL